MPSITWTVLLDLDQTLVLTSALDSLRTQRAWSQIYQQFHRTHLPPGTREFLCQIRDVARLGIVTNTPRPYAEKLVAYHHLDVPVVVAFHDTNKHKPDPEPVLTAMQKLHSRVDQCCYIGDSPRDLQAALNAKIFPIGLCWDGTLSHSWETTIGHPLCSNWDDVLTVLHQLMPSTIKVNREVKR